MDDSLLFETNIRDIHGDQNTPKGDGNDCFFCSEPIRLQVEERGGRSWVDRSNRIDCEDKGKVMSCHLDCYDLEVFGKVTKVTLKQMEEWREKYGS